MRKMQFFGAMAMAVCVGLVSNGHAAQIINFDPDGVSGLAPVQVGSFDFLPGNSLFESQNEEGTVGTLWTQTRLGSLLDVSGNVIPTPGLNSTFEITVVSAIPVVAQSTPLNQFTQNTIVSLGTGPATIQMYYHASQDANDLSGLGFYNGTQIFNATVAQYDATVLGFYFLNNFDQYVTNNYPGVMSPMMTGGGVLVTNAPAVDSSFFLDGSNLQSLIVNANLAGPFTQANPSQVFADGAVIPNFIGNVNTEGDAQLQNDGTGSFTLVPEPSTIALLGFAGLTLISRRRKA